MTKYDQIWFPGGYESDIEPLIMTPNLLYYYTHYYYNILEARWVILSNVKTDAFLTFVYYTHPNEHQMTLIWPFNATQGKMFSGKLIVHSSTCICVSNKLWPERA